MSKVFITSATGNISAQAVKNLIAKGIQTTIYVRDEEKARKQFEEEFKSNNLSVVVGDYDNEEAFKNGIQGHERLFLLVADLIRMAEIKDKFARIALDAGVKQIVDLSSFTVKQFNSSGIISQAHTDGENTLRQAVKEKGGNLVVIRPGNFMTNVLMSDVHTIKGMNKVFGVQPATSKLTLIDPRDIGDVASTILSDPIEKHLNLVYDVNVQTVTLKERADILSKVLGRQIDYVQVPPAQHYQTLIQHKLPHALAYEFCKFNFHFDDPNPEIEILTGRKPRTFEEWVQENRSALE
jgi:uncharacterized protein YbjT (DUF2867 family)